MRIKLTGIKTSETNLGVRHVTMYVIAICLCLMALGGNLAAEIVLSYEPIMRLDESPISYPTGVGWGDIDNNGWHDLVLACGIDVANAPNLVYFNTDGVLSTTPGWVSEDNLPTCNIYLGDLDKDGFVDMAYSSLGLAPGFSSVPQGYCLNTGGGFSEAFSLTPDALSFSCAMGDPDGDGDLDIAYAEGNFPSSDLQFSRIYFNQDGVIDAVSGWMTQDTYYGVDIAFVDIDNDGDHDVALGARTAGVMIFYNDDGVIETTPSWQTTAIIGGRQIAFGDVDGDGYQDLAAAGMAQGFYLFKNLGGTLETSPSWSCLHYNEPSAVAWADVDGDGDLDLAGGGWDNHLGIFENIGGTLTDTYSWKYGGDISDPEYNLQQVAWADYDEDGLKDTTEVFPGDDSRKLFYLHHKPIHDIYSVQLDGSPLDLSGYCYDPVEGWISLATAPPSGSDLTINYSFSTDLDFVANTTDATLIFENLDEYHRPLAGVNVLAFAPMAYGSPYNIENGTVNIDDSFERFGWNVTVAGTESVIPPCGVLSAAGGQPIIPDVLVSDITDVSMYEALILLSGTNGYQPDMANPDVLDLIVEAVESDLVVVGWCASVRALAAADVIDGKDVTGSTIYIDEYEAAGATYMGMVPPVTDGNFVTIYHANLYRSEGSQATYDAIYKRHYPVYEMDSARFEDDGGDGFFDSGETVQMYFYLKNVGTADTSVVVTVTSNDPEVVFTVPTAEFPVVEGQSAPCDNLTQPIEYIVPEVESPRYDTFFVNIESIYGTYQETFSFVQEVGHIRLLIVDDDRGLTYEDLYVDDVKKHGILPHVWDKATDGPLSGSKLGGYHKVFWFTADSADDYLEPADIAAMKDFLDGGGNLFLTGQGLAAELHQEDSAFLEDYLHCRYKEPAQFSLVRIGVNNSPIGDKIQIRVSGSNQAESMTDAIIPVNGAQEEFRYYFDPTDVCGISYAGDYRVVFFTMGYEAISNSSTTYAKRDTVMARILDFLPEFICGDIDNNGGISILDVTYLVNYLYKEGPAPESGWAADPNGDQAVNIVDVTFIINYLYKNGPDPMCP